MIDGAPYSSEIVNEQPTDENDMDQDEEEAAQLLCN